ncbi:MAG TPA: rhomboid family intramembrane serine protease [Longimicrobiaceae bacterium]|nr:rhomboid family intramembrane serine protease [Longimicrobiaceae bacterium]
MIPLRDENPTETTPFMTVVFIALNLVAWFMLQGAGEMRALEASVYVFGTVPCELTGACPQQGLGWEAVLTSMFMHGSWEHILGNMLFLWVFGNNIEDSMGHLRFIVFYLVCGVAAALAHVYLSPASSIPAVGASGAISGIMGAYIVLYPRVSVRTWIPPIFLVNLNAFFLLGYWFFIQLATGVFTFGPEAGEQGGVAVWAHVGGFVAGLVLIKLFEKRPLVEAKRHKVQLTRDEVARLGW